ncbi:MAG: hypothetical protein LKG27_00525 [Clostridiaceae bacterium]|nr:hypothetical protein [Clostridiaceae bacterium]
MFFALTEFSFALDTTASQTVSATLTRSGTNTGGGTGTNVGGIIAGGVIGGTAAGGATALAFAPLLLVGLVPNETVSAAAPLNLICEKKWYLLIAIREHGVNLKEIERCTFENKFFVAQNDTDILNGTYDVDEVKLPEKFKNSGKIKIKITIASQSYGEIKGIPDLSLGIYKDISRNDLNKKFETQQFLHHYLMKKYEIPLQITSSHYSDGIQQLEGEIKLSDIEYINQPLQVVVRYTAGGFRTNLRKQIPKVLTYAYLIEFDK